MERADARRLQPHYIESFFLEAFKKLGGSAKQREARRYEVTHVPAPVRNRDRLIGFGEPVLPRYERIAFEKALVAPQGQPLAAFVCPGHPLLDSVIDITLERYRDLLKRGAVLVDERDPGTSPRVLFFFEHAIQDASVTTRGERRVVSKRLLFVEMDAAGAARHIQYAPYLDYRPLADGEPAARPSSTAPECHGSAATWSRRRRAMPSRMLCPSIWPKCAARKLELLDKTEAAVKDRLTKEINYWDFRAEQLKQQERAGKANARLNSGEARKRADDYRPDCKSAWRTSSASPVLAAATRRARRLAGGARRADQSDARPAQARQPTRRRHPGGGSPRAGDRHGGRARPRLRPDRPGVREARLRHRKRDPRHGASCASSR